MAYIVGKVAPRIANPLLSNSTLRLYRIMYDCSSSCKIIMGPEYHLKLKEEVPKFVEAKPGELVNKTFLTTFPWISLDFF